MSLYCKLVTSYILEKKYVSVIIRTIIYFPFHCYFYFIVLISSTCDIFFKWGEPLHVNACICTFLVCLLHIICEQYFCIRCWVSSYISYTCTCVELFSSYINMHVFYIAFALRSSIEFFCLKYNISQLIGNKNKAFFYPFLSKTTDSVSIYMYKEMDNHIVTKSCNDEKDDDRWIIDKEMNKKFFKKKRNDMRERLPIYWYWPFYFYFKNNKFDEVTML